MFCIYYLDSLSEHPKMIQTYEVTSQPKGLVAFVKVLVVSVVLPQHRCSSTSCDMSHTHAEFVFNSCHVAKMYVLNDLLDITSFYYETSLGFVAFQIESTVGIGLIEPSRVLPSRNGRLLAASPV